MGSRWLFGVGLASLACGGAAPAKAPEPGGAAAVPADQPLAETASLSTVSLAPEDRIWVHVEAPARDLPLLGSFDLGREDLLAVLRNPRIAARLIVGEAAAEVVDLDRPVDMLIDPERASRGVSLAFSVSDPKKLDALELSRLSAGRWEIKRVRSGTERHCEVWHAAAGYRLICAHAADSIESDAAFHLHGPHAGGDRPSLRVEVPGKVWRNLLARRMAAQTAKDGEERPGEELGRAMMLGFFEEQSSLAFELRLEPKSVDVVLELGFTDTQNAVSKWWTGGANAKISETFWRIPKSAHFAFYKGAADPAALSAASKPMFELFQSAMAEEEPRPGVAAEAIGLLHELLPPGGALSVAYGRNDGASKSRGWLLVGLDVDPLEYVADLKKFVALTGLPSRKVPGKKERATESRLKLVGGTAGLPAGSLHLVDESRKNPRYRPAPGEKPAPARPATHVFAVPDAGRIWLSFSEDPAQALGGVRAALASTREQSLASVPELAEPAQRPLSGLGKLDVAALATLSADDAELAPKLKRLAVLPYAGKSPIPVWIEIRERKGASAPPETVSRLVAHFPYEALADMSRFWIR